MSPSAAREARGDKRPRKPRRHAYDVAFKLKVVREALSRPASNRIKPTCREHPNIEPVQLRKWIRNLDALEASVLSRPTAKCVSGRYSPSTEDADELEGCSVYGQSVPGSPTRVSHPLPPHGAESSHRRLAAHRHLSPTWMSGHVSPMPDAHECEGHFPLASTDAVSSLFAHAAAKHAAAQHAAAAQLAAAAAAAQARSVQGAGGQHHHGVPPLFPTGARTADALLARGADRSAHEARSPPRAEQAERCAAQEWQQQAKRETAPTLDELEGLAAIQLLANKFAPPTALAATAC